MRHRGRHCRHGRPGLHEPAGIAGPCTLADLAPGEGGLILSVGGPPAVQARLRDLGFLEGQRARMIKAAPLSDPIEYCVEGVHIGLRRHEAEWIRVDHLDFCPYAGQRAAHHASLAAFLRELPGRFRARRRDRGWGVGRGGGRGAGRAAGRPERDPRARPGTDR